MLPAYYQAYMNNLLLIGTFVVHPTILNPCVLFSMKPTVPIVVIWKLKLIVYLSFN